MGTIDWAARDGVLALELHDLVAVDRIGDRLAHADVVERRLVDVEIEHRQLARVEDVDDRVLLLLHPVDPGLILLPVLRSISPEVKARSRLASERM